MTAEIDWSMRAEHVRSRHGVEPAWADEAVDDPHAEWLRPDTATHSGHSVRVIGCSCTAHAVVTVILVDPAVDASERPDGEWSGSNAWVANDQDRRLYGKEDE